MSSTKTRFGRCRLCETVCACWAHRLPAIPADKFAAALDRDAVEAAWRAVEMLMKQRDELLAAQYIIAQGAAQLAIEKCKNATGARHQIEMFVSANQCADDILEAIAKTKGGTA